MSNYIKQFHFTEDGQAFDLVRIQAILGYLELRKIDEPQRYVVVMEDKSECIVFEKIALELIQALKQREIDVERLVNRNTKDIEDDD